MPASVGVHGGGGRGAHPKPALTLAPTLTLALALTLTVTLTLARRRRIRRRRARCKRRASHQWCLRRRSRRCRACSLWRARSSTCNQSRRCSPAVTRCSLRAWAGRSRPGPDPNPTHTLTQTLHPPGTLPLSLPVSHPCRSRPGRGRASTTRAARQAARRWRTGGKRRDEQPTRRRGIRGRIIPS